MITADSPDLRPFLDDLRWAGGGELALGKMDYWVPGGYVWVPPPGCSIRGEYGAAKIRVVGNGDFTIGDGTNEVKDLRIDGVQIVADPGRLGWALRLRKIGAALGGGRWQADGGASIYSNGGYGVHRANAASSVSVGSTQMFNNGMGNVRLAP